MMGLRIRCVCWRPHVLASVNERVEKLDADLTEMACHLEEKFYPHLLTTISGRRWILTHGLKLVLVRCLNSSEYLTALGAAISHSIGKEMQDGLAAGIDHGRAGRSLADIVAYNPFAEADYNSTLQDLREVDFYLLADLKSHKDASIKDIMNLLRLESPLADAPSMDSLQHDIEQLKVPIHRANITEKRSALLGVWTPLSKPFSNGFGMQFTGITASVLYVSKNGVSLLLDLIMKEEARLLDSTIGRVVPLLPIALDCADSELEASLEKFFDESGGADQGDSVAGGGQEIETEIVLGVRFVDEDNVVSEKPKRPRKKRQAATDASGSSHPSKKLRSDHGTSSGAASAGKSPTVLKQLLASSILNIESGVEAVATLPFVTFSVSATPEHESGVPADSITGLNLRTIGASEKSAVVPLVMTEAVVTTHVASIPSAPAPEPGTKVVTPVHASMFHDSDSTGTVRPDAAGSSHLPGKELSMGSQENKWAYEDGKEISLSGKVRELQSMISVKDRELKDVDATVTSLKSQNDGLADQVRVLETTCSGLQYLIALEVAISRSIKKGIQDGLAVGIDHGRAWRSLADIVAYNPSVEVDFNSTLQELREKAPLADASGMDSLQHDIEQLKVPIV
ncbi:hypothetical protein Tco_1194531 [Tanacetum coccineum]